MSNQECKARPVIININSNEHSFYPYIINAAVVVIILMTHMLNYTFLMLLKI